MQRSKCTAAIGIVLLVMLAALANAETTKKEFRFEVGAKSKVSIVNQFGSVSVKPATGNYLLSGATPENSRVDYEVLVPADASVSLESSTGPLHAERLHGDVEAEGANAAVDVRDMAGGHVHVKTMAGSITLTNIREGHVEVDSVSGDVTLNSVTGPLVRVSSTSGKIQYNGDFGYAGEYRFNSHSGNIDATIPEDASVDVKAQSVRGLVQNDVTLQPKAHTAFLVKEGSSFAGTINKAASSVWLRTFSGKIHLKKR